MDSGDFRVLYLTGAPAAGKSSVTRALADLVSPLKVFEYGERLARYLSERRDETLTQMALRRESAEVARPVDIDALDQLLLDFVAGERSRGHVVIDTHAVTREPYGYRVKPYSLKRFALLSPDAICVLYTPPEVAVERINKAPQGRRGVTVWEAGFHTAVQASVAVTYGMSLGVPVYLIDSSRSVQQVAKEVARLFERTSSTDME